jgi:hypothetical protein
LAPYIDFGLFLACSECETHAILLRIPFSPLSLADLRCDERPGISFKVLRKSIRDMSKENFDHFFHFSWKCGTELSGGDGKISLQGELLRPSVLNSLFVDCHSIRDWLPVTKS